MSARTYPLRNLLYMLFHYQIRPQTTRSHIFAGASSTAGPAVLMFARSVLNSFTILTATSCVVAHFSLKTEAQLSTTLNARQTEHELLPSRAVEPGKTPNGRIEDVSKSSKSSRCLQSHKEASSCCLRLLISWVSFTVHTTA